MESRDGMELRTLLVSARRAAGLTQREVASKAGVPQSTVARIEAGAIDPRASMLDRLFRVLGLELTIQRQSVDASGVDRTLIRESLRQTPTERVEASAAGADLVERIDSQRDP